MTTVVARGDESIDGALSVMWRAVRVPFVVIVFAVIAVGFSPLAEPFAESAYLGGALLLPFFLFQIGLFCCQVSTKPGRRSWLVLGNGVGTFAATVIVFLVWSTPEGAILASALVYSGCGLFGIVRSSARGARIPPPSSGSEWKHHARRARSLYATNAVVYFVGVGDVLIASSLLSGPDAGLYALCKKFGQSLALPFLSSMPLALGILSRRSMLEKFRTCLYLLPVVSCVVLAVGIFETPVTAVLTWVAGASESLLFPVFIVLSAGFSAQYVRDLLVTLANSMSVYKAGLMASGGSALFLLFGSLLVSRTGVGPVGFACLVASSFLFGALIAGGAVSLSVSRRLGGPFGLRFGLATLASLMFPVLIIAVWGA
ncbi:MFS family permease [Nocardioides zeae]|uniref:MFS family permease n=1 Tax=Nocardioides zeae TaxID=1457234 RepID=A0ACC6IJS3_9ACTN|nr:hypothetical protein [Nocardioides zeae]MDR6173591.1 MFS family permease [Nocardioides zeae]MDR6210996.1 MFS family permease [Nocardioides zeae]